MSCNGETDSHLLNDERRSPAVRSVLVAILPAVASVASAQNIRFEVQPDGEVLIKSSDGADAVWDGYTLSCEAGCLDPDGWRSVQDHFPLGVDPMIPIIGIGAFGFGEAGAPNEYKLSEINLADEAVLPAGLSWSIGSPINGTLEEIRAWTESGVLSAQASGRLEVWDAPIDVPEPAAMFIALCAVVATRLTRWRYAPPEYGLPA